MLMTTRFFLLSLSSLVFLSVCHAPVAFSARIIVPKPKPEPQPQPQPQPPRSSIVQPRPATPTGSDAGRQLPSRLLSHMPPAAGLAGAPAP